MFTIQCFSDRRVGTAPTTQVEMTLRAAMRNLRKLLKGTSPNARGVIYRYYEQISTASLSQDGRVLFNH